MENEEIIQTLLDFHSWHENLPNLTDLTTLDYSLEHGHITVEEFEESERALKKKSRMVSDQFSSYENFFDFDLPFYYSFLERLKKFGEQIDETDQNSSITNPGFTKALISDVLKSFSNPETRVQEKIWIILRIGNFLKDFPELSV